MTIPVPGPHVRIPEINSSSISRDPRAIDPAPPAAVPGERPIDEVMDRVPVLPRWLAEPVFWAASRMNKVIFKSPPAGAPIPRTPGSWHFAAMGDFGSGTQPQTDVANNILKSRPELVVTLGDSVYWNGSEAEYARKWDPPQYFGNIRKNLPVMPVLGNHDARRDTSPYFRRFPELNGARYYSFDKGGVHFVQLNSTESLAPESPQGQWLQDDLAASSADWKVLSLHHPLQSAYLRASGPNLGYLAPLIARHGVDLVLSGHEHSYQRHRPFAGTAALEVVVGASGHTLHPYFGKIPQHTEHRSVEFGHLDVEVTSNALVGRYVGRDGSVRDTFSVPNATPGVPAAKAAASSTVTVSH